MSDACEEVGPLCGEGREGRGGKEAGAQRSRRVALGCAHGLRCG